MKLVGRGTEIGGKSASSGMLDFFGDLAMLFVRFALARVFFLSGLTKWSGIGIFNETTYDLFRYEYFCPEEKRGTALYLCDAAAADYTGDTVPFFIDRLANITGVLELLLPAMLFLGLATRFAALGLFGMSVFITLFVYPDTQSLWMTHIWWIACSLAILVHGPGRISIDRIGMFFARAHRK